jgi:tetratricopeptide (TPR) repeat protein
MRTLSSVLLLALLLAVPGAPAQQPGRQQAVQALAGADVRARREAAARLAEVGTMADMKVLAAALRDPDAQTRERVEEAMWRIWARSGNAEVDRLYQTGIEQMSAGDLPAAIATFSRVIELDPGFAEGWNKRATLYFLAGELRKSLADCDEVMKRNPYHFGALAGYAQIYVQLERYDRALEYARRALEVNPNLEAVRRNIEVLEEVVKQRRKQMT